VCKRNYFSYIIYSTQFYLIDLAWTQYEFKNKLDKITYKVYTGYSEPATDVGSDGDLHKRSFEGSDFELYVRTDNVWKQVDKEISVKHPTIGWVRVLQVDPPKWISHNTIRSRNLRKRMKLVHNTDEGTSSSILNLAFTPLNLSRNLDKKKTWHQLLRSIQLEMR
jgi:hypothetical protein